MDLHVGANDETLDFDPKHLGKRVRNSCIAAQFQVGGVMLTTKGVASILELSTTCKHSVKELVNPIDKQNVKLSTDFMATSAVKEPGIQAVGFRVSYIAPASKLLGLVMEGVLAIDDALLHSTGIEKVFWETWDFLTLCADNGVTINEEKFQFCQDEVECA